MTTAMTTTTTTIVRVNKITCISNFHSSLSTDKIIEVRTLCEKIKAQDRSVRLFVFEEISQPRNDFRRCRVLYNSRTRCTFDPAKSLKISPASVGFLKYTRTSKSLRSCECVERAEERLERRRVTTFIFHVDNHYESSRKSRNARFFLTRNSSKKYTAMRHR